MRGFNRFLRGCNGNDSSRLIVVMHYASRRGPNLKSCSFHHFYTGHTRRGLWYLAFVWLAFPVVLRWIDAVRLALLDETQFQARLMIGPVPQDGRT